MSERMAAEIWIGGPVSSGLVESLCAAITAEGVGLEWGEGGFHPKCAADLLDACQDQDGTGLLCLYDCEARWGQFEDLEKFLVSHNLSFTRRTDGRYEFDPELLEFRPGKPPQRWITNHDGEPTVGVGPLRKLSVQLDAAERLARAGLPVRVLLRLRKARRMLVEILPPEIPPLPPFTIQDP